MGREDQHGLRGSLGDSQGWPGGKLQAWGGGAEAWRPPDPTRPRQPGQRGRWGRGQRPKWSRGWGMGGQAEEGGLAPGSWPGRPPIGEGVGWVRGQLLGWGGWPWGQAGSS